MNLVCCEVTAPGKVILHGEHSVVYGKTAIAASLGLRTKAKIEEYEKDEDLMFVIVLPKINFKISFSQNMLKAILLEMLKSNDTLKTNFSKPKEINHDKYVEKISTFLQDYKTENSSLRITDVQTQALLMIIYLFRGIILNNVDEPRSLLLTVDSALTIGAGTGSSASFAVALAAVMLQYIKYKNLQRYYTAVRKQYISEEELMDVEQHVFSDSEKTLISDWAFACERIAHGSPSGVDNATCTYGSLVEFKKGEKPTHHTLKVQLKILLVDTKVSRQTKDLVQKVADLKTRCPHVVNSIMDALNQTALAALEVIKKINNLETKQENESERNDLYQQLTELFDINHKLLAALDVSHESLEKVRSISWEHGFSAKLTGAGGGGYAIVLIPPNSEDSNIKKMLDALALQGFDAKVTDIGVEGVKVLL